METRTVKISDLQPTDTLKDSTMRYYSSLTQEEFIRLQKPQVWSTDQGLIISDGNNYTVFCASRGQEKIEVQYGGHPENFLFLLDKDLENARILKELGVNSPYDLLNLIDWSKFH